MVLASKIVYILPSSKNKKQKKSARGKWKNKREKLVEGFLLSISLFKRFQKNICFSLKIKKQGT